MTMAKHISFNAKSNDYVDSIPLEVFENTPKAVWAAIAISFAVNLVAEGDFKGAAQTVVKEWVALHQNGIVPQVLPAPLRKYNVDESELES
jgi:hypothetical protein